jgi:hypothetical protein
MEAKFVSLRCEKNVFSLVFASEANENEMKQKTKKKRKLQSEKG